MRMPSVGENMAVFVLFFGISLLEAFASHRWLSTAFWVAMALLFLRMSVAGRRRERREYEGTQS